ncbi:hypothetical protein D9M70_550520 [compost metagenome]
MIGVDLLADQLRVGGPDDGPVQGIDIAKQSVGQVLDMVEKLVAGGRCQAGTDVGMLAIQACVEQLGHGGSRWKA